LRRNCILKHITEGKKKGIKRRGIRRKQLLNDLDKERRCWKQEEEAVDRTVWRTLSPIGCGTFVETNCVMD
jgi:hypothetical protein